jgi:hypothetical protein
LLSQTLNYVINSTTDATSSKTLLASSTWSTSDSDDDVPPLMPADSPGSWFEDDEAGENVWPSVGALVVTQGTEKESEENEESPEAAKM